MWCFVNTIILKVSHRSPYCFVLFCFVFVFVSVFCFLCFLFLFCFFCFVFVFGLFVCLFVLFIEVDFEKQKMLEILIFVQNLV